MKKSMFLLLTALICSVPVFTHAMDDHMAECKELSQRFRLLK